MAKKMARGIIQLHQRPPKNVRAHAEHAILPRTGWAKDASRGAGNEDMRVPRAQW
jgi:hypothetical protein